MNAMLTSKRKQQCGHPNRKYLYLRWLVWHITTIPTASLGFSTRANSQKVSTSDYNTDRQPEIALQPPKPEIVIPLKLQQIASKFQQQVPDFRPWRARIVSPSDCDNDRQPDTSIWTFWAPILQFLVQSIGVAIIWLTFYGAHHHRKSRIWLWNFDAICQSSRDVIISGLGGHIGRCCTRLPTLFSTYA